MRKVIKILYIFRSLLLIPMMWFIMELLDIMTNSGFFGILFLVLVFLFMILGIIGMLFKEHNMNKLLGYNIVFVIFELFVCAIGITYIIYTKDEFFIMNDDYFKTIFGLFSLIILGICANTWIITGLDMKKIQIFSDRELKKDKKNKIKNKRA